MSFKKKVSKIIMLGLIVSFMGTSLCSKAYAMEENENIVKNSQLELNSNQELLNVLKNYFSYQFKYINDIGYASDIEKYEFLDKNSLIEEYFDANNSYNKKLLSIENSKIDNFSNEISYEELSNDENILKIDVKNTINFKYQDSDMPSSIEENHIMYLQKENDKYKVIRDLYDSEEDLNSLDSKYGKDDSSYKLFVDNKKSVYDNNINKIMTDIENDKNKISEIDSNENESTSNSGNRVKRYVRYRYDGNGAARWAVANCNSIGSDYPADCTNFVSKAMFNGGHLPVDKTWYHHSGAWNRVVELRNWLISKGYAREYDTYKHAYKGDIIQYKNSANVWRHSVIVTTRTSSYPYVRVTAHSNNRVDVNVSGLYYPNGDFKSYRVLQMR
ncbi:MAG: amidase domain-containing protein [Paraclostridium sp.]